MGVKTSHIVEILVTVCFVLGTMATSIADAQLLPPKWAAVASSVAVAALAVARGLSNTGKSGA